MFTSRKIVQLLSLSACLIGTGAFAAIPYAENYKFSNKETWEVPEATLPPGDYVLAVHDKLLDREIFQVKSAKDGKVYSNFLAIRSNGGRAKTVLNFWTATGETKALRSWFIANEGETWDFVYPKERAIELAKASGAPIPAVDLSSMPKPTNLLLSPDDLHSVQLWLLTPKRVGPGTEGVQIAAAKIGPKRPRPAASADETHTMPRTSSNFLGLLLAGGVLIGFALVFLVSALRSTPARS